MQQSISITTHSREGLYDITNEVAAVVAHSGVHQGLVNVYVRGATAGIIILWQLILQPMQRCIVKHKPFKQFNTVFFFT